MRIHIKLFKPEFRPKIIAGTKFITIRPCPRRAQDWPEVGDYIDIREWSGRPYNSPQIKVGIAPLVGWCPVDIFEDGAINLSSTNPAMIEPWSREDIAKHDGFDSQSDMMSFFLKQHRTWFRKYRVFNGMMWRWNPRLLSLHRP